MLGLLFGVVLPGGSGFDVGVPQLPGATQASGDGLDNAPDPDAELKEFVRFVVNDVQVFWRERFSAAGREYEAAGFVLFSDATVSGCGPASSAVGPFYCPATRTRRSTWTSFFEELDADSGPPATSPRSTCSRTRSAITCKSSGRASSTATTAATNEVSVKLELQADCYAGVWAHATEKRELLVSHEADFAEAMHAAAAIGDDPLQSAAGRVDSESWTHGSSEQLANAGSSRATSPADPGRCDTFSDAV